MMSEDVEEGGLVVFEADVVDVLVAEDVDEPDSWGLGFLLPV